MPYCPNGARGVTLTMVVARPHRHGGRDVNLHARSARRAPRSGAYDAARIGPHRAAPPDRRTPLPIRLPAAEASDGPSVDLPTTPSQACPLIE